MGALAILHKSTNTEARLAGGNPALQAKSFPLSEFL
jgi:hypothetical protein